MVSAVTRHNSKWLAPAPVWQAVGDLSNADNRKRFNRPAILRFKNDSFMDELLALMSYYPDRLIEWRARPETWREPMATPATLAKLSVTEPRSLFSKQQTRQLSKRSGDSGTGTTDDVLETDDSKPLKLYQPAHQRYYLVTASLVCRRAGLPDRAVDSGRQEQLGFVLRRLVPTDPESPRTPDGIDIADCDEYAFVITASGPRWRNISQDTLYNVKQLLPDEERLPMFPVGFDDVTERKRKLLAGFIPVARREAYINAQAYDATLEAEAEDAATAAARVIEKKKAFIRLFEMQVAGPWKDLISQAFNENKKINSDEDPPIVDELDDPSPNNGNLLKVAREQIQTISWYVLVDFVEYLKRNLRNVYDVLAGIKTVADLSPGETEFYNALSGVRISNALRTVLYTTSNHNYSDVKIYLVDALEALIQDTSIADDLEAVDVPYDRDPAVTRDPLWPDFLFPLADPEEDDALPLLTPANNGINPPVSEPDVSRAKVDALTQLLTDALPDEFNFEAPEVEVPEQTGFDNADGWFVIRCVYEKPNCGPFSPALVSDETEPFKMASFFDSDAPGRAIRIPMPLDISPAGLRKFNKNATLMISDMLCGKIRNIKKITFGDLVLSVLPWPFHKDLPKPDKTGPCGEPGNTFGMFCSLSIPIVTLCALILLIIMVTLFDLFFRWLPLLFVCLPIPGLKGKKS